MALYRILVSIFALVELTRCLIARDRERWRARLGKAPGPERAAPHLWLHAASNGELASARPVIEAVRRARPDLGLLVTCNSATGVALARRWDIAGLSARLAPLDLRRAVRRVLARWRVVAHVTTEAELWPNRLLAAEGPVIVLGGRLTERSARGWRRFGDLPARVLGRVRLLSAQDADSAERFHALGLPRDADAGIVDLKTLVRAATDAPPRDLALAFPRDATWLAASTHEGEDEVALEAHLTAHRAEPQLRLILAPRHPHRAEAISRLAAERGLRVARRSRNEPPQDAVYLADTLGEMPLWYALAGRVFIGGTLTDRGGHTPYEPAVYGCALIHGPDLRNFAAPFAALGAAGAARQVEDAAGLAAALTDLRGARSQRAAGDAARETLQQDTGFDGLMHRVLALLPPPEKR